MEKKTNASIELCGVRTHNLKIDRVGFPLGSLTVVTGLSGSGKSSLVFDTLYSESYRRYVENLSSFARQYLKTFPKPLLESCHNLPPSVAIKQHQGASGAYNNRSTVGSLTELTDFLRILFTHLGEVYCRQCGEHIRCWSPEEVVEAVLESYQGKNVLVTAPLARFQSVTPASLITDLLAQGFSRVMIDQEIRRLSDLQGDSSLAQGSSWRADRAFLITDRIHVEKISKSRIFEAVQLAFRISPSHLMIYSELQQDTQKTARIFSQEPRCVSCEISYRIPSMALLNFNHPLGACEQCQGFGQSTELDWSKIIPDQESSLAREGVAAWNFGQFREYYTWARDQISELSRSKETNKSRRVKKNDVLEKKKGQSHVLSEDLFVKKFSAYSDDEWEWLKIGRGRSFDGIMGFFRYMESKKYKPHYRIHLARFRRYVLCSSCLGKRFSKDALAIRLGGLSIADAHDLSLEELFQWSRSLAASTQNSVQRGNLNTKDARLMGVHEALDETIVRLEFLLRLGLTYLSLNRGAKTLSGGELQRIHLGRCLGSALEDTLYCLDEPTSGLHPRDSHTLLGVIRELLRGSNTVVMVEHDRILLRGADHVIEIGPKAGSEGGQVVYQGPSAGWNPSLVGAGKIDSVEPFPMRFLSMTQGKVHNLKNVSIRIPLGRLTVICGVSGSGKTSLVEHCLYPSLQMIFDGTSRVKNKESAEDNDESGLSEKVVSHKSTENAPILEPRSFVREHRGVMLVSQGALSRSSRSNIATYLGIMDELRKLMAKQQEAVKLGLGPSAFSFNSPTGRCETCNGLGLVVEDLSFLGEVEVICPSCQGRRFSERVLTVTYKNLSINQIFDLTVRQARDFFSDRQGIRQICDRVVGMGLGYLTLGQSTSSFSGGEAQRLKLLSVLAEDSEDSRPMFLIFDEPTRGLSRYDIMTFLENLRALTQRGHTIVVVEHHVDVMKAADWLIEVGPEAAQYGGEIVFMGSVADFKVKGPPHSATRPFLKDA